MIIPALERQPSVKLSLVILSPHSLTDLLDIMLPGNYELISDWHRAQGEILGIIDGDLKPHILRKLLEEIEKGADLSFISLNPPLLSPLARSLGVIILPEVINRVRDPLSRVFLVRREAIAGKKITPVGAQMLLEVIAKGEIRRLVEVNDSKQKHRGKVHYLHYFRHLIRLRLTLSARFVRFCVVGIAGVVVDMGALFLLSDPLLFNLPVTISKIIASELGIIHNFLWNDSWTFRDIARQQPGIGNKFKRLLKFNFVCLTGLIISVVVFYLLYHYLGLGKYLANFLAIAVVTFWNFWLHSKLSWRVKK
ncbi:GtrA family protein [Gloeocapsa sp. PCC 73106]|uniref:GtrA family protein n=1 Tax=Gloeocapsa sp. PCC 73106 TaxID=102232 RepID=UPI0002ABC2E3|nr:GtrA family protein [Gloeocapsa sp. PCC 73106]ELR97899.1 putative membrane protein [Gloeocapsa sp. PCC 73106]